MNMLKLSGSEHEILMIEEMVTSTKRASKNEPPHLHRLGNTLEAFSIVKSHQ